MKADFSGYATKAGLKCSDGRTIMPDAFKHQDNMTVPLVWQHGHTDPENVLGHAILENRVDGVYAYGFFNHSQKATHTKELLDHGDIKMLSIWANDLIERAGRVLHGAIREVSLVLSGANPGAVIENVTIRHSNGEDYTLEDDVIIYTGLELEHSDIDPDDPEPEADPDPEEDPDEADPDDKTIQEVYDSMTDEQREVLHSMLGAALQSSESLSHADVDENSTVQEVYDSMNDIQKQVLHFMIGEALANANPAQHDNIEEGTTMSRNVFEAQDTAAGPSISHAEMMGIVEDAKKTGSLKESVEAYALSHGITDIDVLFPEAQTISSVPEFLARRMEWVNILLGGTRKSPFTRIKTISADLTFDEARAKGYVKGTLKKEEFFGVSKRITIPATIYKKQKLDRDDMIDITDFDVVTWLKGEMRVMLDEELARAVLLGDGRDIAHEDKISEQNIRPIASDHELYTTTITVNIDDASSSITEVVDAIILNRQHLRGTGQPTMYTTETYIARFLLLKDGMGRRMYKDINELANELRVAAIVPVEVMEEYEDIVAVLVNPVDYVLGADKGGQVSMFDDFDIDYNQYKYLIETRVSGALVKLKSAMVVRKTASTNVLAEPAAPTFDSETGAVTIVNTTGVVYKDGDDVVVNAAGSPYTVAAGETMVVNATPAAGYYFGSSMGDSWSFSMPA